MPRYRLLNENQTCDACNLNKHLGEPKFDNFYPFKVLVSLLMNMYFSSFE